MKLNWYLKCYFIPEIKSSIYNRKLQDLLLNSQAYNNTTVINGINMHSPCDHILQ